MHKMMKHTTLLYSENAEQLNTPKVCREARELTTGLLREELALDE